MESEEENVFKGRCLRCGGTIEIPAPIDVMIFCKKLDAFTTLHEDCQEAKRG